MSAASPKVPEKAQEPSMEEILASIRRIIADDQNAKAEVVAPAGAPQPENDDVLDLAEIGRPVRKPPAFEAPPAFKAPIDDGQIDFDAISFDDDEPELPPLAPPEPPPKPVAQEPEVRKPAFEQPAFQEPTFQEPAFQEPAFRQPEPTPTERLTSAVTDASVAQAFHMLSNTVLSAQARTLEDLVQDMLRPMLKGWLDENLPSMVERLVRAEIERVARGR